jgi:hypothetical protein
MRSRYGSSRTLRQLAAGSIAASALSLAVGSPPSAAADETSLGRVEFQKRANAICATYTREISALGPFATRAAVDRWAILARAQTRSLTALAPPARDAIRYRRMLTTSRAVLPLALEALEAERAGETARFKLLYAKVTRLADERTRLANSIGLRACGKQ